MVPRAESRENIEGIRGLGLRKAAAVVPPLSLIQTPSYGEWEVGILSWETELEFLESGGHASEAYVRGFDRWLCKGLPSAPIKSDAVDIKLSASAYSTFSGVSATVYVTFASYLTFMARSTSMSSCSAMR